MTDAKLPEEPAEKGGPPPPLPSPGTPSKGTAGKGAELDGRSSGVRSVDGDASDASDEKGRGGEAPNAKAGKSSDASSDKGSDKNSDRKDGAGATTTTDDEPAPLLHKGNPLRWLRGGLTTGLGTLFAFFAMAQNGQARFGVPIGAIFIAVAAWGVMDLLGSFDDAESTVSTSTSMGTLAVPIAQTLAALLLFLFALGGASSGLWSQGLWAVVVTASFLGLVAAVFELGVRLGPWAKDELGLARPLWKREGFWVIVAATLLYLPMLGNYSLWDPWETHYGEVSREILARDDWISLWWAQDGWFWSKPILDFWIQALAMATLGVHYKSDQMLLGVGGATAHPEWAVRAPVFLITVLAMYLLYKGCAKAFGRRPALLGSLVLATMSDWFFLGHQTMTDMPFIASMTAAMGCLLLGLHSSEETTARTYEVKVGSWTARLSGWHLVFGAILISALPQIIYLISRNLELVVHGKGPFGFHAHWDEFRSGSAGNCGLPGNEACTNTSPASIPPSARGMIDGFGMSVWRAVGAFEPFLQGLLWAGVAGAVLYMNWGERRVRRLYYLAAWYFAALATMAKGPAGFGLPMICAFAYVCSTRRWKELLRFEMLSGLLIILAVAIPWYVAMYVRHGSPFTDRLIFHDMFNRAFHHVHDTNEGDDTSFRFYVWQLGYALFPWTGLAPLALLWWLRRPDFQRADASADQAHATKGDAAIMLLMWFLFSFALFSFMGTKFHHYIFPAVPPVAMLLGVTLDDMIGDRPLVPTRGSLVYLAGIGAGVALTVAGVARFWPGSIFGDKPEHGEPAGASYGLGAVLLVAGIAVAVFCMRAFRPGPALAHGPTETPFRGPDPRVTVRASEPSQTREEDRQRRHEQLMVSAAAVAGALILLLVGRDLSIKPDNADQPGAIRLLHLFTYNYRRPWPDTLDFGAILWGFSLVAVVLGFALSVQSIRRHIIVAFFAFGTLWAVWGLDVYMVKTAPHWGQHEVIQAYYDHRKDDEILVAYQMNWKGENFYTGNHVPAFVSSGATFTTWLKAQREKGAKVMYFVTEHGRIGGLKSEIQSPAAGGPAKSFKEITDKALDNKFLLVEADF
jgi:4-amino-4-deoxy-L-arabinose transferase-like glycosyltransferase